jgi:hypothetical protein
MLPGISRYHDDSIKIEEEEEISGSFSSALQQFAKNCKNGGFFHVIGPS